MRAGTLRRRKCRYFLVLSPISFFFIPLYLRRASQSEMQMKTVRGGGLARRRVQLLAQPFAASFCPAGLFFLLLSAPLRIQPQMAAGVSTAEFREPPSAMTYEALVPYADACWAHGHRERGTQAGSSSDAAAILLPTDRSFVACHPDASMGKPDARNCPTAAHHSSSHGS